MDRLNGAPPLVQAGIPAAGQPGKPSRIGDAAQQFEALLLSQILHSARGSGGWLGINDDAAGDSVTDFAEQQLANVLASQGGMGLAHLIAAGLHRQSGE